MIIVIAVVVALIALVVFSLQRTDNKRVERPAPPLEPAKPASKHSKSSSTQHVLLSDLLPEQFVVLDLETTGLDPRRHQIIEIGAIKFMPGKDHHPTFQCLVKAKRKLSPQIVQLTGINDKMLDADGIALEDAMKQFVEFVGDLSIVTYNADFDIGFLYSGARQCGLTLTNRYTCALKRARRAWPGLNSYKLAHVANLVDAPRNDHHRALADAHRTVIVFCTSTLKLGSRVQWTKPVAVS